MKAFEFPIAEIFDSVQGEGAYTGTPMRFIRLAGCNVGRYAKPEEIKNPSLSGLRILYPKHAICETVDGFQFACDTDYHKAESLTALEAMKGWDGLHFCITGGEPFMYDIDPFVMRLRGKQIIHVETSGTKPIPPYGHDRVWITCCPKAGFLQSNFELVDEWKFIIHADTDINDILTFLEGDTKVRPVYLQPYNGLRNVDMRNMQHTLRLVMKHPRKFHLSAQLHKFLEVR